MKKIEQEKDKEIMKTEFQKIDIEKEQIVSIFPSILNYMYQKNILKLYDDYWLNPVSVVYPLIVRWKNLNKRNILDLECGLGRNFIYFYELGFKVTAIDGTQSAVDRLKKFVIRKNIIII